MMKKIGLILLAILPLILKAENTKLKLVGDAESGYNVNILYNNIPVSSSIETGEFNLYVENEDYSIREYANKWKATSAKEEHNKIILSGSIELPKLTGDIHVSVIYKVINDNVVEKSFELKQTNLPFLYYSLETSISQKDSPSRYWSFDNANHQGGTVHETYPAAGYFIGDSLAVGLLTDAGDKNLWTRNIRRRPSKGEIGFRALKEICDANLYQIPREKERNVFGNTVRLTFGEVLDFNNPKSTQVCPIPPMKNWKVYNDAKVSKKKEIYTIEGSNVTGESGFRLPYLLEDGFYTVRMKHRSNKPITLRLWKGEGVEADDVAGFHYQTSIPSSSAEWTTLEETVFIANTENGETNLLIAASSLAKDDSFQLELKDIEIVKSVGKEHAYHRLEQGKAEVKKTYVFVAPAQPTLHDIRLASQVYLADGLGFEGSKEEKCLYSCYQMLMWITSRNNFNALNVPSINYAPDMYNRDSFWSMMGTYDKEASESVFYQWAATQTPKGGIGTIVTPAMGSREVKGNDATLEFLWYALVLNRLYDTPLAKDKLDKAFEYIINEFDPDGDGICSSEFVLGQNDVVEYPNKTSDLSVNQGMFAVTLRVAKELGFLVSDEYIEKANDGYRHFYDKEKGYIIESRMFRHSITFNSLLPEFVSWWLFDEPILTSEMVINTLNKIPTNNGYSPLILHADNTYFTQENKPFSPEMFWDNGIYYNAGSWMREEICGYVAGMKHGWKPAEERIKNRLAAEITIHPEEPFSHEFLPYDLSVEHCWWPSTRVFSWNVFTLRALEVAGMRSPKQDPMYSKYSKKLF